MHKGIGAALTDVFAGAVCSILSIAYCLSYAALIFTGPLAHFLSYGVSVTFLSAAVAGAVVASRSSLFFAVAGPDSSISVIIAAMVATLMRRMAAGGHSDVLEATLIVMALATAATGIVLCILGVTRAGRAIRFVPFPVIGGFLGATGWLMITGAVQVVTDRAPTFVTIGSYAGSRRRRQDRSRAGRCGGAVFHQPAIEESLRSARTAACGICGRARGVTDHRGVCGHSTSRRMDVHAATGGGARLAVEGRRVQRFVLEPVADAQRRSACHRVCHRQHAFVQYDRHRDRDPKRRQYRPRP